MTASRATILLATLALGACAAPTGEPPDFAAKNRPLEERCAHQKAGTGGALPPGVTQADVRAAARAAAQRGELDKACDWL